MASSRWAPPHGLTCSTRPPGVPRSGAQQQGEGWGTARLIQGVRTARLIQGARTATHSRPQASTAGAASLLQLLMSPWRAWPDLSTCPSTAVTGGARGQLGPGGSRVCCGVTCICTCVHNAHARTFRTHVYTRAREHNTYSRTLTHMYTPHSTCIHMPMCL